MIRALILAGAATLIATAAFSAPKNEYGYNTTYDSVSGFVAADVVREPAFVGDEAEKGEVLMIADEQINAQYCSQQGGKFAHHTGIFLFDASNGSWFVAGACQ